MMEHKTALPDSRLRKADLLATTCPASDIQIEAEAKRSGDDDSEYRRRRGRPWRIVTRLQRRFFR